MTLKTEADVKRAVKGMLSAYGAAMPPCWWYMPVQTGYGVRGVPDFVVCMAGRFIGIEAKSPTQKTSLTLLQQRTRDDIVASGGRYVVVRTVTDLASLDKLLGELRNERSGNAQRI